jgi:excisionase family DNA binding protein
MSNATIRAKANAHYTCQECGSTELIHAHHEIPGDDDSLIVLCAECHSKRHPDLSKSLFLSKSNQPYWHNKSTASMAKQWGVSSRTIIRTAKKLEIKEGELTAWDEELIKNSINKLNRKPKTPKQIKPKITLAKKEPLLSYSISTEDLMTVPQAAKAIKIHFATLYRWIDAGTVLTVDFGGITFVPKSEVDRLIKKKATEKAVA